MLPTWSGFQYQSQIPVDVLRIVVRALARAPGQRLLIMLSPGFITGGMESETAAIADEAARAHVVFNALDSEALMTGSESPEANVSPRHARWTERTLGLRQTLITGMMTDVAAATGGKLIENTNDFSGAFDALTALPEISYQIAFSPPGDPDNKFHALRLRRPQEPGYRVDTRRGYFAARAEDRTLSAQDRIDRMAGSDEAASPFPAAVHLSARSPSLLQVDIAGDLRHVKFARKEGRLIQEFTFVTLLKEDGTFLAGKQSVMDLALTGARLADLQKTGIHAVTSFPVSPGAYRIREVVREAVENRISACNIPFKSK